MWKKVEVPFYVLVAVGCMVYLRKDNGTLNTMLIFLATIIVAIIRGGQIDNQQALKETNRSLNNQDVQIAEIKKGVNGGSEKLVQQHIVENASLDKRTTAEIHKRDGLLAAKDLLIEHLNIEIAEVKTKNATLDERLANCLRHREMKE